MTQTDLLQLASFKQKQHEKTRAGVDLQITSYYFFLGGSLKDAIRCIGLANRCLPNEAPHWKRYLDAMAGLDGAKYKKAVEETLSCKAANKLHEKVKGIKNDRNGWDSVGKWVPLFGTYFKKELKGKVPDEIIAYLTERTLGLMEAILFAKHEPTSGSGFKTLA